MKKSLEQNTIDTEWRDTTVYDPLNEKKVYEIGKKYEENFFPNGLKNSPLEKSVDYGPAQSIPDKRGSSGAKKYAELFAGHYKPETDILLKPLQNISEAEIKKARRFSMFENKDLQLGKEIDNRIGKWYDMVYGTAPQMRDETGRQIEPTAKIRTQNNDRILTKDGFDLEEGLRKLAERMSEIDNDNTSETGVAALQKSLNILGAKPPLKTDGQLGSQTVLQTRRQLVDGGYLSLAEVLQQQNFG